MVSIGKWTIVSALANLCQCKQRLWHTKDGAWLEVAMRWLLVRPLSHIIVHVISQMLGCICSYRIVLVVEECLSHSHAGPCGLGLVHVSCF